MNSKRGILGSFIVLFVATVVIVIILMIMVIGSGIVKKIDNFGVQDESKTGLKNVIGYMDEGFVEMTGVRIRIVGGSSVDEALLEVGG